MTVARGRFAASALVPVFVVPAAGAAAQDAPRTPWGTPDLQGIWDFKTATPLERPEDRGEQAFLTEEEAATIEQERVERNIRLWEAPPRRTEAGGNVGGYNNFWLDFGTNVIDDRRTSLIVDPPDGRRRHWDGASGILQLPPVRDRDVSNNSHNLNSSFPQPWSRVFSVTLPSPAQFCPSHPHRRHDADHWFPPLRQGSLE